MIGISLFYQFISYRAVLKYVVGLLSYYCLVISVKEEHGGRYGCYELKAATYLMLKLYYRVLDSHAPM